MKKLLAVMLFALGAVSASGAYATLGNGDAQRVTRAEAAAMGLNKTSYYLVYNTEDMARLDDQIIKKLENRSAEYYSVVYFVPRRNKDHYQAMVTEYKE